MKFSKRVQVVQPSVTLSIDATARALKAKGVDVISFGAGEPDFPTPANIKNSGIEAIRNDNTRYTSVGGTEELKDAILAKLKRDNGLSYERNQVIVSCGAKHSFYNLAQVLWEQGDEVIIPSPYWVSFPEIVRLAGATPVLVPGCEKTDYKVTVEQLEEVVNANSRALLINSPCNPTGSAYTKKELEALAEFALRHKLLIISDEIYEKIVFDGFQHTSIASLSEEVKRNCVLINGVSKSYAMTGWRIGYLVAEPEITAAVTKLQSHSTSNPPSISQVASVEALLGPQDEVDRMVAEFQKRRDLVIERLRIIPGVTCFKPVGTFYSFPNFSGCYGKTYSGKVIDGSLALGEFLLNEFKVALVPGIAFGADQNMRFSFATSVDNINRGLDRISEAIGSLK